MLFLLYIFILLYIIYRDKKKSNEILFFFKEISLFKIEYYAIFLTIFISFLLAFFIIGFSFFFVIQKPDFEKLSTYECGFEPYNDSRHKFDIKFYLLAMIFIIFDIEVAFLLPWSVSISKLNSLGFWSMIDFIFELNFIYLYLWSIGAFDWE